MREHGRGAQQCQHIKKASLRPVVHNVRTAFSKHDFYGQPVFGRMYGNRLTVRVILDFLRSGGDMTQMTHNRPLPFERVLAEEIFEAQCRRT